MIVLSSEEEELSCLRRNRWGLKEFPDDDGPNEIAELGMKDYYISVIPKGFLCSQNLSLVHIDLAGNCIKNIPDEIGLLLNLKYLDLSNNHLEELPSIWGLNLRYLYVDGNQIQNVPKEIGRIRKLKVLHLKNNSIRSLPPEIGHCVNLKKLVLSENNFLQSIPEVIARLRKLTKLCVDRCSLLYLPFFLPKSIKHLKIFNNQYLTHIPAPYWNLFWRFNNKLLMSKSCTTTPSCCYTIIEKNTNRCLRLCPRTKRVFCCFRNKQNAHSLFEYCLRSIHHWSKKGAKLDTACLPMTLRDYVKNGPIAICMNKLCHFPLFSEYFLLIFTIRDKEFITATFCSRLCGLNWVTNTPRVKNFICDWESWQI